VLAFLELVDLFKASGLDLRDPVLDGLGSTLRLIRNIITAIYFD